MTKYIFVTGGVTSSLGKGIIAASLAKLLQARGYKVTIQKFDPYINIDPGTLDPYEHGECYVTEDGAETDLDLGHYERFLNVQTSQANNVTTGRIYQHVIEQERSGAYLGKTVQVVPHITDEIKRRMLLLGENGEYDIVITELGGTVGDIESLPFIEAVRQLRWQLGNNDSLVIHLTLVPFLAAAGELKTKPTQHSVKTLLEYGIQPDVLVCRTEHKLSMDIRKKLALFCNVNINAVIESIDAPSIYDVPLLMLKEQLDRTVLAKLKLPTRNEPDLGKWKDFLGRLKNPTDEIHVALVGKYVELPDAYISVAESFKHAAAATECKVKVSYIASGSIKAHNVKEKLKGVHGILVAPGFGQRGIEGKIEAIRYARENLIPFFGISLGLQCAIIEFARNVLNLSSANSTEIDEKSAHPVIKLLEEHSEVSEFNGKMRLGTYDIEIKKGTKAYSVYAKTKISERHRHKCEFNKKFLDSFRDKGMIASGSHPESEMVEIIELKDHPYFLATQFHPELKSTVGNPHPLFVNFVDACIAYKKSIGKN